VRRPEGARLPACDRFDHGVRFCELITNPLRTGKMQLRMVVGVIPNLMTLPVNILRQLRESTDVITNHEKRSRSPVHCERFEYR
jgi:hypothetical protein